MNQIQPYPLWIGHALAGHDFGPIFDAGVRALVQVAEEEPPSHPPRELICCRIPLLDGAGNSTEMLYLAIHTVVTLMQMHIPTLVYCGEGMSRAPAISAAALAIVYQGTPEMWLERIVKQHPSDVSPGLWKEIVGVLPSLRRPAS
jgi:hypothetical protein